MRISEISEISFPLLQREVAVSITTGWDWVHMTIGPFTVQMTRYEARQTALLLKTTLAQGRQLRPYGEEIKMWGLDTGRSL